MNVVNEMDLSHVVNFNCILYNSVYQISKNFKHLDHNELIIII